jgi:cytochrome c-type biogenesis protein CcmH/NrfG
MGRCYLKLGRKAEAIDAFAASLRLNPEQPDIAKTIEDLRR